MLSLKIRNCPKLIALRGEWDLFQHNSLKDLTVSDEFENVKSFPEENLLPPTLACLTLTSCSKLRIMNYKGLLHLKSLKDLKIEDCPSLESLPEQGLPKTLSTLRIIGCPLIKQKYQKEEGERWHTILHIPSINIDYNNQHEMIEVAVVYDNSSIKTLGAKMLEVLKLRRGRQEKQQRE